MIRMIRACRPRDVDTAVVDMSLKMLNNHVKVTGAIVEEPEKPCLTMNQVVVAGAKG
jgi:hypothetical protein